MLDIRTKHWPRNPIYMDIRWQGISENIFEDANGYNGKPHFATFRKADRDIEFVSDCII